MKTARKSSSCILGLLAMLLVASAVPSSAIAEAGPAWKVGQLSFPTNFVPGSTARPYPNASGARPQYSTLITNVGGAATSGTIVVTETLPEGIMPSSSQPPERRAGGGDWEPCETAPSGETVTCEVFGAIQPVGSIQMKVPVDVEASAPTPAVSSVEVSGGGAPASLSTLTTDITAELPPFELPPGAKGAAGRATTESGSDATLAGSHPFLVIMESNFPSKTIFNGETSRPIQTPRNFEFRFPRGLVANPQWAARLCTEAEINSRTAGEGVGGCPPESQVGSVQIETEIVGIQPLGLSLYDMKPPPGVAAEFAFSLLGTIVHIDGGLDGSFRLTASSGNIIAKVPVLGIRAVLWGNPADSQFDVNRRGRGGCGSGGCSIAPTVPFLTMPTSCTETLSLEAILSSWQGGLASSSSSFFDAEGNPLQMEGCNALAFEPTIESKATTNAGETPTGLDFNIHQPQNEAAEGRATAALRDTRVTLPEGMTVNAAAANGLGSCTEQQMGYQPEEGKMLFKTTPQSCPDSAKVGSVEVTTPLLGNKLPGAVYVAKPFDNPFGTLLALYLVVEDEESGVISKLAGKVEPNPVTGRLTATFPENPQLPLNDIDLHFFNGPSAALQTPLVCGTKTTETSLTPWSTPEGADAHPTDSFQTSASCSASEAAAPKTLSFVAGTESPLSGAYSPFSLRIARKDGTQHIAGIETVLPQGLTGKLAGIPYCPESAIAQAKSRETPEKGREEQTSPSCPSASAVGAVQVTAGAGISPIPVSGHAYLAGPYKGAPLSMVVIVPAVAGPFDLGTVVSRVALSVGEYDARIRAVSDPLPTILDGIPLDVRSIEIKLDRPAFTLNPTSCEASSITGSVTTQAGQSTALSNRFQVGECGRLKFKPKLSLSLKGGTKRAAHPALKAVLTYPKGGENANIARAQVSLPHAEFLDQSNIGTICTQPQLKANSCPAASIYGRAKAWTPLLAQPLQGNVYLVGGFGHKLPDLVAELNGQIRVLLRGKVDTTKQHGIRNTFEAAPDAPVEKFVLEMKGGRKYGLLINSEDICRKEQKAQASFTAANGKVLDLSPKIGTSCKKAKKKRGGR